MLLERFHIANFETVWSIKIARNLRLNIPKGTK